LVEGEACQEEREEQEGREEVVALVSTTSDGEYEVLAPISEGGMASVWLGRAAAHPDRLVALKFVRSEFERNKDFVVMFLDEARIASRLKHPNIVSIVDVGYDGKRHFIAMEVLRGHTLLALANAAHARGRRLPYEIVAWIGARVADALHYAHELVDDSGNSEHIVHRDVNPANIFITLEGEPKLIDFGLAKARDRIASTAIGVVKGKLAYLAPEQVRGHPVDRRSDVFALGITLWETSLDRRLFLDETDLETIRRVRETQVPDPMSIDTQYPRALAAAVGHALARDPNDRYQTAAQLRDALDAFIASCGRTVDASSVRALRLDLLGIESPLEWERMLEAPDKEKTRVWERPPLPAPSMPPRLRAPAPPAPPARPRLPFAMPRLALPRERLLVVAACGGAVGLVLIVLAARGCRGTDRVGGLEQRVARVESLLGLDDAGVAPAIAPSSESAVSADDRSGPCAIAKVAGYEAWQDALAKARANASGAEAACASIWSEKRKQACFYVAMSGVRAIQAARDSVVAGGAIARDALKSVKDEPKNDAIARARAASQATFTACDDDAGL
jgi:eukaryotic-like serine/threonine-protein kinase